MIEMLVVIVLSAAAVGLGWPMVGRLAGADSFRSGEHFMLALAAGMILIATAVYAVGWIRLDRFSMGILLVVALLGAVPGLRVMPWNHWLNASRETFAELIRRPGGALLWLSLAGVGLFGFLQGLAPPNDYDSLHYHLALAKLDLETGRLVVAWHEPAYAFFPILMGSLTRLVWALSSAEAAQMTHGLFAFIAAGAASALTLRLGGSRYAAVLAALAFLSVRTVVWEMATAQVDLALAAFAALAFVALLAWFEAPAIGLSVLFGLMLGGAMATKYLGVGVALAFAPLLLPFLVRERRTWLHGLTACVIALVIFAPYGVRNALLTGNPVFPIFNSILAPNVSPAIEAHHYGRYGMGYDFPHLLTVLWDISVQPLRFDGMNLGSPYLIALAPAGLLAWRRDKPFTAAIFFLLFYLLVWFWLLSQQTRFLLPAVPVLAALVGIGVPALWNVARSNRVLSAGFIAVVGIAAVNQAMFVGIYMPLRLPVALGLMSPENYHRDTPSMEGAHYGICRWLTRSLKPDETALIWLSPNSSYCPQKNTFQIFPDEWPVRIRSELPPIAPDQLVRRLEDNRVRYILVQTHHSLPGKRGAGLRSLRSEYGETRYGRHIGPVLDELTPLFSEPRASAYDGDSVLAALRRRVGMTP